ncbi:hypothetical protein KY285_033376 [Solanum tuberosum]|nr:hypothetical protein KY285_033376 [Solanum tuberosum]
MFLASRGSDAKSSSRRLSEEGKAQKMNLLMKVTDSVMRSRMTFLVNTKSVNELGACPGGSPAGEGLASVTLSPGGPEPDR